MPTRFSDAVWDGSLREGSGNLTLGSGAFAGPFTWVGRFEDGEGTNPEELLAAAHAACYAMALSSNLAKAGYPPEKVRARSNVTIERVDGKNKITAIHLEVRATVPGITGEQFQPVAESVKEGCPISGALAAVPMTLDAALEW